MRPKYAISPLFGKGILYIGEHFICYVTYNIHVDDEEVSGSLFGNASSLSRIDPRKPSFVKRGDKKLKIKLRNGAALGNRIEFLVSGDESIRICREAASRSRG